jgi:UDP-sugar transporter A1/2/3
MVAILSVAILGRVLRCIQWIALVLVTCGIIFVKMSKEEENEIEADVEKQDTFLGTLFLAFRAPTPFRGPLSSLLPPLTIAIPHTIPGLLLLIGAAYCSSLAGVYFELVLKSTQLSLWARNVQLAGYSIVIGLVGLACTHDVDGAYTRSE